MRSPYPYACPMASRGELEQRVMELLWSSPAPQSVADVHASLSAERELACVPGDYPAYYAGVRDAILGVGPNPVPTAEVIRVIGLLELGLQSAHEGRTLPVSQDALQ